MDALWRRQLVADALFAWREAERLLDDLPLPSRHHETVALEVSRCRATYQGLTRGADASAELLASNYVKIHASRAILRAVRARLGDTPYPA